MGNPLCTSLISEMYTKVKLPISGCGGVVEWQDVVKYILAGATTVQISFLVYTYGYSIIEKLNNGLLEYMIKNGYESIEDFKGNVTGNKIKGLKDVSREKTLIATVDENLCIGCKRCTDISYTKVSILQMGHPLIEIVMAVDSVRISVL